MPDGVPPTLDPTKADPSSTSSKPPAPPQAMRDLVEALERARPTIADADPKLDRAIHSLRDHVQRNGSLDGPNFRALVAYALTDFEKLAGPVPSVHPALREEMTALAGTMPGLRNERVQDLMRATPGLQDPELVREVRVFAKGVTTMEPQNAPSMRSQVEALENKVRLSTGGPPVVAGAKAGDCIAPLGIRCICPGTLPGGNIPPGVPDVFTGGYGCGP